MKKKIAIIINSIDYRGPGMVVLNLLNNLNQDKFDISLITLRNKNNKNIISKLKENNIKVIEFGFKKAINVVLKKRYIIYYLKKEKFDIIHSHGIVSDYLCSYLPSTVTRITTLHCNMYEDYPNRYGKYKGTIIAKLHLSIINRLDLCICCSRSVYNAMDKYLSNGTYITNGIDIIKKESTKKISRRDLKIPSDYIVYVFVGTLNKGKNITNLIKLFKNNKQDDEVLLIVGDGESFDECKEIAASDKSIIMVGRQVNVYDYLKLSNAYISFSKSEGMSISCLEALANGDFLLLSNIDSHKELIDSTTTYVGELFNEYNFKEKKEKLRQKIKSLGNSYNNELITCHEKYFSGKVMTKAYEKKYIEEIEKNKK